MNSKTFFSIAVVVAFVSLVAFGYFKQVHTHTPVKATSHDTHTKEDIEKVIKEYILENPELIEEAMRNLYNKKAKAEAERASKVIKEKAKELEEDPQSPKAGNCGYCKHMLATKKRILEELKDVQIIFKELPILGENSKLCARSALAVNLVDSAKYFNYHSELLTYNGDKTPQVLEDLAKKVGIDIEKYRAALSNQEIDNQLTANVQLASNVGIRGTPAYIAAGNLVPGAISFEEIKASIDSPK
jgi:hypothetical protein